MVPHDVVGLPHWTVIGRHKNTWHLAAKHLFFKYRVSHNKLDRVNGSKLRFMGQNRNLRRKNNFEQFNKNIRNFFCRKC